MIAMTNTGMSDIHLSGICLNGACLGASEGKRSFYPRGIVAAWKTYGKSNSDTDRAVLKDYSSNGHDINLNNFSYSLDSGYGKFGEDFNTWTNNAQTSMGMYKTTSTLNLKVSDSAASVNCYSKLKEVGQSFSFTVKVTGITKSGSRIDVGFYQHAPYQKILEDGIYKIHHTVIPGLVQNRIYFFIFNPNKISLDITITQIPEYQDGLIFDGIDDYGVCENMPILTKEKGYTIVALRKWLNTTNSARFMSKSTANSTLDGAFVFEIMNTKMSSNTVSFGASTIIEPNLGLLSYQTEASYNGNIIQIGNAIDTDALYLGALRANTNCAEMVFYAAELYDRALSTEELQSVKDRMLDEWYENAFDPAQIEYQALWTANGKTNNDIDKNVPNLVDASNPLVPTNFAWALNSGYDLWPIPMPVDLAVGQPYGTLKFTSDGSYSTTAIRNVTSIKIKFTLRGFTQSVNTSFTIRPSNDASQRVDYKKDGEYEFTYNGVDTTILFYNGLSIDYRSNFYVDIIPEGKGLSLDGVDDKFRSKLALPISNKYTVVFDLDITQVTQPAGLSKFNGNWHIYGSILYISGVYNYNIPNKIGFTSNGLIVEKIGAKIGNTGSVFTAGNVFSINNPQMLFRSLAITLKELNEQQTRAVREYLKTLKANNI